MKIAIFFFFASDGQSIKFEQESCPTFILLPTSESVRRFRTKIKEDWRKEYYLEDFQHAGIYIYATGGHFWLYNKTKIDIVKNILKEMRI